MAAFSPPPPPPTTTTQAFIRVQIKSRSFQFSSNGRYTCPGLPLMSPDGCNICPRPPGLASIIAQGITRMVAAVLAPSVYLSPIRIMPPPPPPGHYNLGMLKKITTACTIAALFHYFSRQNALRQASLSELKVLTKVNNNN